MARIQDFIDRQYGEPQKQEVGIGGFTALVRVSESYKLTSEVPTTPVEDGSFINDHIILKPLTLTISGDVSDIHLRESPTIRRITRTQAEIGNLTAIYGSQRTQSQIQATNALINEAADAVRRLDDLLDRGEQALNYFGNRDTTTKPLQEQFIDAMEALHYGKQIIAIDMPYRRHPSMVITAVTSNYDNETDSTTFTIEAQAIHFAELQFVKVTTPAPGLNGQTQQEQDKGAQEGKEVERSLLSNIFGE